jgi:hypothetical protein
MVKRHYVLGWKALQCLCFYPYAIKRLTLHGNNAHQAMMQGLNACKIGDARVEEGTKLAWDSFNFFYYYYYYYYIIRGLGFFRTSSPLSVFTLA